MLRYIARRFMLMIPVLFAVSILVFGIIRFAPGDPVLMLISLENYTPELAEAMRKELGLDRPLPVQYWIWLKRVLVGDLGESLYAHEPVVDLLLSRVPRTVVLTLGTFFVATTISIPLGVLSATHKDSWIDNVSRVVSMIGISMPVFWFGLLLLVLFALKLMWLPPGGDFMRFGPKALILPSLTMGASYAALMARLVRTQMIEVLQEEYIRVAWSKGLRPFIVHYRHALKNAMLPVITVMGLRFGELLGGAVLTETVFDIPGVGRLLVDSVGRRDYPVLQGCILMITVVFVATNLIVDITYALFDPRIRYE